MQIFPTHNKLNKGTPRIRIPIVFLVLCAIVFGSTPAAYASDVGPQNINSDSSLVYGENRDSSIAPPEYWDLSKEFKPEFTPAPAVTVSTGSVFLGESFSITATFQNNGDATGYGPTGYGPFIDLYIPHKGADGVYPTESTYDGISPASGPNYTASLDGENLTVVTQTFPDDGGGTGCVDHPWGLDDFGIFLVVCGTAGDQLVSIELPYGSYTPAQPQLTVSVPVHLSEFANPGTPLTIRARGGFKYGATPEVDWCCTVPIDTTILSDSGAPPSWVPFSDVNPSVISFSKSTDAGEVATGPNSPATFTMSVDLAPGQSFNNIDITDTLPNNLVYLGGLVTSPVADSFTEPTIDGQPHNSDTISLHWDGPFDSDIVTEITASFDYYIPEFDANGAPIAPGTTQNQATLDQIFWTPADGPPDQDISGSVGVGSATTSDQPITLAKNRSISINAGPAGFTPGDVILYTVNFEISDYYGFDNLSLVDVLPDGQHYYTDGTHVPTISITRDGGTNTYNFNSANITVECNYTGAPGPECDFASGTGNPGETTITFDIDQELTNQPVNSQVLGDLVADGGSAANITTYGSVQFYAVMLDKYTDIYSAPDDYVKMGDSQSNSASITGEQVDPGSCDPSPCIVTGTISGNTANAGITVGRGTLEKDIVALNGAYCNGGNPCIDVRIAAGDTITYRIQYDLETGDYANLTFTDYLPLPIFYADDPNANGSSLITWLQDFVNPIPDPGTWTLGPGDTRGHTPGTVDVSPHTADNYVRFDFGDFDDPTNTLSTIELLFTVRVTDEKFGDGLKMRNSVLQQDANSPGITSSDNNNVDLTLTEPILEGDKSAVSTSHPGINPLPPIAGPIVFIAPGNPANPPWNTASPINSTYLDANPLSSDIEGIDGGDLVKYALTIENTGSGLNGAFDIVIKDTLPTGLLFPGVGLGGFNLQVYRGDGVALDDGTGAGLEFLGPNGNATDLFGDGIRLMDPEESPFFIPGDPEYGQGLCQIHEAVNGKNVIIITYDLLVDPDLAPGTVLQNKGEITEYSGEEGGENYIPQPEVSPSNSTIANLVPSKILTGTEIDDPFNAASEGVIGETVFYELTVTIPESISPNTIVVDTMGSGLAFISQDSFVISNEDTDPGGNLDDGISFTGSSTPVITDNGHTITWDLGTVSNTNNDDSISETLIFTYTAVILNIFDNQSSIPLTNSVEITWETKDADGNTVPGTAGPVSPGPVTVIEPVINTTKSVVPPFADAGDSIAFQILLENPVAGSTSAFEIAWLDNLPADLTYNAGTFIIGPCDVAPDASSDAGPFTATWAQIDPGQSCTISFQATVEYSANPGQQIINTGTTTWTSLSGDFTTTNPAIPVPRSSYNIASSVERTGADGVGVALNNYASAGSATLTIDNPINSKYITDTSESHTGFVNNIDNVAIGEIIRYRIISTLPEGTSPNFQVRDQLPDGLIFLNDNTAEVSFVSSDGIIALGIGIVPDLLDCNEIGSTANATTPHSLLCTLSDNNIGSSPTTIINEDFYFSGTDPWFKLGILFNNDNDPGIEYVVIEFNALVHNDSTHQNDAGDVRVNNHLVYVDGNIRSNVISDVPVRIVEPVIAVTKNIIAPPPNDGGDVIQYEIILTNTSAGDDKATAYDLNLTDVFDLNLTNLTVSSITSTQGATCVGDGSGFKALAITGSGSAFSGNSMSMDISCLDPSESVTIQVSGNVVNDVIANTIISNSVTATGTSLGGGETGLYDSDGNFTGSNVPGNTGEADGDRDGSGTPVLNDYLATAVVDFTVDAPQIDKTVPSSQYTIGDLFTYDLIITLPEGITQGLVVIDDIPVGLAYVSHNVDSSGYGGSLNATPVETITPGSGGDLTLDFGDTTTTADGNLTNNSFVVEVTVEVLNVASNFNGIPLQNTGRVQYSDGPDLTDSVDVLIFDNNKTLVDQLHGVTTLPEVAIGEILTYEVVLTIPPTTMDDLHLIDTLDRGLAFVDCDVISAEAGLETNGSINFAPVCANPTISTYPAGSPDDEDLGRKVDFDFGTLANNGAGTADLTVRYFVVVLDSLGNQSGSTPPLNNQAEWVWDSGNFSEQAVGVVILEPDLTLSKTAYPTKVYLNQTITFTLRIAHTGISETDAYEVELTDIVPSELNYVAGSLRHVSGQTPDLPLDDSGAPTLVVTWSTFDDSDVSVIAFDVVFDPSFRRRNHRQTITNIASLSWTSLPGDFSGVQTTNNPLSTERYYDPLSNVNVYAVEDGAVIVIPKLPGTGFAPGRVTALPVQSEDQLYSEMNDLLLVIPSLDLSLPIVSIPQSDQGWDLTWLWDQAGWLEGTAYPSWVGNTVLTGHAYLSTGLPGPFVNLQSLAWGDEIILYAHGLKYTYQVRMKELVTPEDHSILEHKDGDWITLFTCREYSETQNEYLWRQAVQAVLVDVEQIE